ncbi:MAG TPA: hypothetical protein PLM53_08115 [Spirochaetota bacterium]|nr:hypothetical protein [Spirochaetota bacterium]HPC42486.1 hypothetical protein [Spirochaetota bacterium]HPL15059.1 hypothetical protein [Spirochaetota bacterium]HQF08066.1 hypothetical protein [Spirochaetota bacterium]HQH97047.1 hypothetical protein [Spirochaetota bacterium]
MNAWIVNDGTSDAEVDLWRLGQPMIALPVTRGMPASGCRQSGLRRRGPRRRGKDA